MSDGSFKARDTRHLACMTCTALVQGTGSSSKVALDVSVRQAFERTRLRVRRLPASSGVFRRLPASSGVVWRQVTRERTKSVNTVKTEDSVALMEGAVPWKATERIGSRNDRGPKSGFPGVSQRFFSCTFSHCLHVVALPLPSDLSVFSFRVLRVHSIFLISGAENLPPGTVELQPEPQATRASDARSQVRNGFFVSEKERQALTFGPSKLERYLQVKGDERRKEKKGDKRRRRKKTRGDLKGINEKRGPNRRWAAMKRGRRRSRRRSRRANKQEPGGGEREKT